MSINLKKKIWPFEIERFFLIHPVYLLRDCFHYLFIVLSDGYATIECSLVFGLNSVRPGPLTFISFLQSFIVFRFEHDQDYLISY